MEARAGETITLHESHATRGLYDLVYLGQNIGHARLSTSGYIWDVEVDVEHRGRGRGKLLMLKMIERARYDGHPWVRVRVHDVNHVATTMYRQLGFKDTVTHGYDTVGHWVEAELEIDDV